MNNTYHKAEELLQKGKTISLSNQERIALKSELLSYATYHGIKKTKHVTSIQKSRAWFRSLAVSSFAFSVFVGVSYASVNSLPGEPLYGMKVSVIEEIIGFTKISERGQLQYHHELYTRRLDELHALIAINLLTPATVAVIETEMSELAGEIGVVLSHDIDHSISFVDTLQVTNDVVAITEASKDLVRSAFFNATSTVFEDTVDKVSDIHANEIGNFVAQNASSTVELFFDDQLTEISEKIKEGGVSDVTTIVVADYVDDATEAILVGDNEGAVVLITEALQRIEIEAYQYGTGNEYNE